MDEKQARKEKLKQERKELRKGQKTNGRTVKTG